MTSLIKICLRIPKKVFCFLASFHSSTDATVFGDFIDETLCHCGRWLELKPVLVMDNASFHHSEWFSRMCTDAGVKLAYFPLRLPDLNPIEEFFAELKGSIRRNWRYYAEDPTENSAPFSNGILIRLEQEMLMLEAIFGMQV